MSCVERITGKRLPRWLVSMQVVGRWHTVDVDEGPQDVAVIEARFTDGTSFEREAAVQYVPGQREKIMEIALSGEGADENWRAIIDKRSRALMETRRQIQLHGENAPQKTVVTFEAVTVKPKALVFRKGQRLSFLMPPTARGK